MEEGPGRSSAGGSSVQVPSSLRGLSDRNLPGNQTDPPRRARAVGALATFLLRRLRHHSIEDQEARVMRLAAFLRQGPARLNQMEAEVAKGLTGGIQITVLAMLPYRSACGELIFCVC